MLRNHRQRVTGPVGRPAFDDFHDWVLSLPWIVERHYALDTPGIRCFAVECEPLDRHQMWLLTGLQGSRDGLGLAVVVPLDAADYLEEVGWGRVVSPMPAGHALVTVYDETVEHRDDVEALVLTAYGYAMS
jgi:hypothetical protein